MAIAAPALHTPPSILSFSSSLSKPKMVHISHPPCPFTFNFGKSAKIVCTGMLSPKKFIHRRRRNKQLPTSEDARNWIGMMNEIDQAGSAVSVLQTKCTSAQSLPRDLVLGTLVRFKQLKKWNLVSEILEWLRTQDWWDFKDMDFLLLITAYGKLGDFGNAESILSFMNKQGCPPTVGSHTALMEAYGRAGQYNKAESIFRRMQLNGPQPSALTYQIILNTLVQGNKFDVAESIFRDLLSDERPSFKPDQKMFHMMIFMYKKAGSYQQARELFKEMEKRGIPRTTVTFNSLMSFENSYKEVSSIYDQMQRAGLQPDVVSYTLLIKSYGKARREEEALAVFEEMLDSGTRPTKKAYNTLLDAFAISGMVEQARTVFKSMRRDKCTPDVCSYTTMLSAYVNASDMDGAEKFFRRFKQDGLEPNVVTYGALLKGYAKVNDMDKMMRLYEDMRIRGIRLNEIIFTTIMDAHGKDGNFGSAVIWYKQMESSGITPDQKAKNILLSLANTAEEQSEAKDLVQTVTFHGKIAENEPAYMSTTI